MPRPVQLSSVLLGVALAFPTVADAIVGSRDRTTSVVDTVLDHAYRLVLLAALIVLFRRGRSWARGCLEVITCVSALAGAAALVFRDYGTLTRVGIAVEIALLVAGLRYLEHRESADHVSGRYRSSR